jgi:hypothetical protein
VTTQQVAFAGAIGGLVVLVGLLVSFTVMAGVYVAWTRLADARAARRERRRDLAECRAIDALGTTNHHPKDSS